MKSAEVALYRGVLANSAVFKGLPAHALTVILERALLLKANPGDVIFFENMRGGVGLYVVIDGDVEIFRAAPGRDGTTTRLGVINAGECFGEYSLLDGHATSASAQALQYCTLLLLAASEFQKLVDSDAEIAKTLYRNLLVMLIDRLRKWNEKAA